MNNLQRIHRPAPLINVAKLLFTPKTATDLVKFFRYSKDFIKSFMQFF